MARTHSSQNRGHNRVSFPVLKVATSGDIDAMTIIQRHFDPYIRRIATVEVSGTSYINTDLYDRLRTRLIMATLKFKC